jgi:four helix bundle protein
LKIERNCSVSGTFEDLLAWQRAMELVVQVYRDTEGFPRHETYGLTSQLRRAAVSVASNVAEGKGRGSDKELIQFLNCSRGSIYEIQTQLLIAQRLGYLTDEQAAGLHAKSDEVGRLLNGLIKALTGARPAPTGKITPISGS